MISRRRFLTGLSRFGLGALALSSYGVFVEPLLLGQRIRQYDLKLARWPAGLDLSIAVIADLHACEPWMDVARIAQIVEQTNNLGADLIVLLGDYASTHRFARRIDPADWARPLAQLRAPLGVHAILGNHDWWDDRAVQAVRRGPPYGKPALERVGIPVY